MQWYEIFVLSILEILSILLLWSKLNNKVNIFDRKSVFITIITPSIATIFFIYNVDIGFIINYIVLCIIIKYLFTVEIKDVFLQFFIVLSIIASIQLVFTYILFWAKGSMNFSFINGLIVNMAILTTSIFIYKFIIFDKAHQYLIKYKNYITIIFINIGGIVLLLMYMWQINKDFVWNYMVYILIAILIWETLNIYFLYQSVRIKQQEKVIDVHEKYEPILKDMISEIRQRQHDFKNHLSVLYGLVQIENDQQAKIEIKQYIESVIEGIKSTDQFLNIKDNILSAIIYSKKALTERKNICFKVKFKGEIPEYPLEKYELVELLGNLLDNAIEAAESNNNKDNPKVVLILGIEEESKVIEVRNTGGTLQEQDINKIFQRSFSTKKGKHRGYGLYNVKKIVNYYNGTIELSFDSNCTVFRILF